MTLRMLDSITVANLPAGADAYLGYVDGRYANAAEVKAKFPGKTVLTIAVFSVDNAEAADCEPGDMLPTQLPGWVKRQQARGVHRPVLYASISAMATVKATLAAAGIARSQVRLWSAHYGLGKHICPGMDGTQWTDKTPGAGGSLVDESVLLDDFFQEAHVPLSDADLKAITNAVWQTQTVTDPAGPPGQLRTAAHVLTDNGRQIRAVSAQVAAVSGQEDPAALAKAILAGLDPKAIAAAVAAAVGPVVGKEVVAALEAQFAK
jgi:hypothetical protein